MVHPHALHLHERLAPGWAAKVQQRRNVGLFQARLAKHDAGLALRVARCLDNLGGRQAVQQRAAQGETCACSWLCVRLAVLFVPAPPPARLHY